MSDTKQVSPEILATYRNDIVPLGHFCGVGGQALLALLDYIDSLKHRVLELQKARTADEPTSAQVSKEQLAQALRNLRDVAHREVSPRYSAALDEAFTRADIALGEFDSEGEVSREADVGPGGGVRATHATGSAPSKPGAAPPPSSDQYTIEPHGDGHALYSGRDSTHHGFNLAHITEATPEVLKLIEDALNARVAQLPSDPYELGIKRTWEMADPLRPPGQPGSYARGYHNGIVDALHQLRANIDAEKSRAEGAQPTSSVTEAAKALVLKLKQIEDHPSYQSVWVMAGNRGIPYTGPNYAGELQSLKEALGMYAETKNVCHHGTKTDEAHGCRKCARGES